MKIGFNRYNKTRINISNDFISAKLPRMKMTAKPEIDLTKSSLISIDINRFDFNEKRHFLVKFAYFL